MQDDKRSNKLRVIIILLFIFSCIPIALFYLFIRDISSISSFLNDYIGTGSSLFIPILPNLNLLWYLPEPFSSFQFSLGHLIDIFILINIIGYIQSSIYHYFKRVCLDEFNPILMYSYLGASGSEETYYLAQDAEKLFNFYEINKYPLINHAFEIENLFNVKNHEYLYNSHYHFKDKIYNILFSFTLNKSNKLFENSTIILFLKIIRRVKSFLKNYNNLILTNIFNGRGFKN
ncbi:MAG: hypothetical protein ACFFFB_00375 [Candidatus Heimdallarchaeota archaeon]